MIKPNINCMIFAQNGYDAYGAAKYGQGVSAKCFIIQLLNKVDRAVVRVDSGASRGSGKEKKNEAVLLFSPQTVIEQGSKVEILNEVLQVVSIFPRYDLRGKHDHNQVELIIWQSE